MRRVRRCVRPNPSRHVFFPRRGHLQFRDVAQQLRIVGLLTRKSQDDAAIRAVSEAGESQ